MSKLFFRAAGWISADRSEQFRLTSEEQADLQETELITMASEIARKKNFAATFGGNGTIEVGQWSFAWLHVEHPAFAEADRTSHEVDETAERALQFAARHPYDRRQPVDLAHWAAQGALAALSDRGGLDNLLEELDDVLRCEIVEVLAAIARRIMATSAG